MVIFTGFKSDIVAEPLGLFVRIRMAADINKQCGVIHRDSVLLAQSVALSQSQRDDALPQNVLHGLTEAQVDTQRQRGDQLSQPDPRLGALGSHCMSLTCCWPGSEEDRGPES